MNELQVSGRKERVVMSQVRGEVSPEDNVELRLVFPEDARLVPGRQNSPSPHEQEAEFLSNLHSFKFCVGRIFIRF